MWPCNRTCRSVSLAANRGTYTTRLAATRPGHPTGISSSSHGKHESQGNHPDIAGTTDALAGHDVWRSGLKMLAVLASRCAQPIWKLKVPVAVVPLLVQLAVTVPPLLRLSRCHWPCSTIVPETFAVALWSG